MSHKEAIVTHKTSLEKARHSAKLLPGLIDKALEFNSLCEPGLKTRKRYGPHGPDNLDRFEDALIAVLYQGNLPLFLGLLYCGTDKLRFTNAKPREYTLGKGYTGYDFHQTIAGKRVSFGGTIHHAYGPPSAGISDVCIHDSKPFYQVHLSGTGGYGRPGSIAGPWWEKILPKLKELNDSATTLLEEEVASRIMILEQEEHNSLRGWA